MRFPGGFPTPRLDTSRLMYSRVVRFVDSWIFITERLCCRFMNVIRETYIFSPLWENWTQIVVCWFVRVVQVVDSWIFITETMETICIIYFCGNHSNLFDASVMASVFTDNVILSRLLFVLHFIGESFWKVNDFIRVARRYCLWIIEDDKERGRFPWSSFVVRQKACCSLTARFYVLIITFALRSFINHLWCQEYLWVPSI